MVKISIITATFNSGKTVRDTLESVLRQDYKNYELIIKDGGSKDDTLAICEEYKPRFEGRMRIISCPDMGIYDAMNQGIAAATGDVVGILNSDDFYTSFNILTTISRRFEQYPDIDAVYGDIHYVSEEDTTHIVRYYSSRQFRRWWMRLGFMPAHPSFYCRKSTYDRFQVSGSLVSSGLEAQGKSLEGYAEPFYFNPSYKIAADFEDLLRMIFVGKIKTRYVYRDFVTMRMGGASSSGFASYLQIYKDHVRAFRENAVYSNVLLVSLRYCYKLVEIAASRLKVR